MARNKLAGAVSIVGCKIQRGIGWFVAILFGAVGIDFLQDDPVDIACVILSFAFMTAGILNIVKATKKLKAAKNVELEAAKTEAVQAAVAANPAPKKITYIAIECPSCGANIKVPKGQVSTCEYCDSQVQG